MNPSEIQEYWRWKLVRQVSCFINAPDDRNTQALLQMIEAYPKARNLNTSESPMKIEPTAADFVCTMDL